MIRVSARDNVYVLNYTAAAKSDAYGSHRSAKSYHQEAGGIQTTAGSVYIIGRMERLMAA